MPQDSRSVFGRTLECARGSEYHEGAFRYFLGMERARAGRSNRALRVLFATVEPVPGQPAPIPAANAARLFDGLKRSLRDTDIMGWYQQGRVASAVLSGPSDAYESGMLDEIEERVSEELRQRLPSRVARSLHVRVIDMTPARPATA